MLDFKAKMYQIQ